MDILGLFSFPKNEAEEKSPTQLPNELLPHPRGYSDLLRKLADLKSITAKDLMSPRSLVEALDVDVEIENMPLWKTSTTLHFPVYEGDLDRILGWISNESLRTLSDDGHTADLRGHYMPVHHISENTPLDQAFIKFVQTSAPLLVVQNESGGTAGVLYLNDVLEAFFGVDIEPPEIHNTAHG
jgi:CBS domain containing-hemolysin-like protein